MLSKKQYVLAVLSAADKERFTPVQIQKAFFILDREIPDSIKGPMFDFKPYDYGPFDSAVYHALQSLADEESVYINGDSSNKYRTYSLTAKGRAEGIGYLNYFDRSATTYITEILKFVTRLSFSQLVTAIYKKYPDMKVNSVFSTK